jgi:hypothetical protein
MQNVSPRFVVAIAVMMCGSLLLGGSNIYGVAFFPRDEVLSAIWPLWVVALVPITVGLVLLRRAIKAERK